MKSVIALMFVAWCAAVANPARADDLWGCQVLLCLSDPRGPTHESECHPPIDRLWDHLRHGGAFPTCAMAGSEERGGSWAKLDFIDTGEYCSGSDGGDADMGFTGSLRKKGIQIFIDNVWHTNVFLPPEAGAREYCDRNTTPTKNVPPKNEWNTWN